jgi:hypothetical protein
VRTGRLALAIAVAAGLAAAAPAAAVDEACRAPPEHATTPVRFERVRAALAAGGPARIVVFGTASSAGAGNSALAASYPVRLQRWLERRWGPGRAVVINASRAGRTAAEMADRLAEVIRAERPDLVVWQTGTVDAVRGVDLNDFGDALLRGIRLADEAGVDLLLVDSQFGAQAFNLRDVAPYLDYLDQIVRGRDVALFHRYAIMKHWSESGRMNLTGSTKAEHARVADRVHDCIAQLLARMIADAAV